MEGVCSAQVQAQNKHSRELKTLRSALILHAAFADINIHKGRSVYYWLEAKRTIQRKKKGRERLRQPHYEDGKHVQH